MANSCRYVEPAIPPARSVETGCHPATECRASVRTPYETKVEIDRAEGPVKGRTTDLSSGGLFVATNAPFQIGEQLELKFHFRLGEHSANLRAQVVRKTDAGVGLKLL